MKQEDKELLLRDICARLPYKVNIQVKEWTVLDAELKMGHIDRLQHDEIEFKPYLRSMSSMTEKENRVLNDITYKEYDGYTIKDTPAYTGNRYVYYDEIDDLIDFYNSHHLDFRGLIEKGLALEAPEGMYNSK